MNCSLPSSGLRRGHEMASVLRRELAGESGCYCCHTVASLSPRPVPRNLPASSSSTDMTDLDASLRELGMLSAVTDSRHDYVLEKLDRNSSNGRFAQQHQQRQQSTDFGHHHSGLCVLAMNSAYIADFSFSAGSGTAEGPPSPSETVPLLTLKRPRVRALRRKHYLYQPYDYPWKPKLVAMLRGAGEEQEEPPAVPADMRFEEPKASLENGNKSNPGSPAKPSSQGGSSAAPLGGVVGGTGGTTGIFRSKSLDDLEVCSAKATGTRMDIETVSRKISNLHVS